MRAFNLGILTDNIETSPYKDIWKSITKILTKEKVTFFTVDDLKNKFPHKKESIDVYLTINDEGVQEWNEIGNPSKKLIVWFINNPIELISALESYISTKNLTILSTTHSWIKFLKIIVPEAKILYFPLAIDPKPLLSGTTEKFYNVSFITKIDNHEDFMKYIKSLMKDKDYEIINEIINFSLRNPMVSVYDAIDYYTLVYSYNFAEKIDNNSFIKLEEYINDLKRIKIIKALKDYPLSIWGNASIKQFLSEKQHYMGEVNNENKLDIIKKSKIFINFDSYSSLNGVTPESITALASKSFVLTDSNILLRYFYPKDTYDIYYDLNDPPEFRKKLNFYLNNPDKAHSISSNLHNLAIQDHSWKTRTINLIKILSGVNN